MKEILNKGRFKIQIEQIKEKNNQIEVYGYFIETPLICTKKQFKEYDINVDDVIQGKYKEANGNIWITDVSPIGVKNPHCLLMTNITELWTEKYKQKLGLKLPDLYEAFVNGLIEVYVDETGIKDIRYKGTK